VDRQELDRTLSELRAGTDDIRPSDVVSFSEPLRSALNFALRIGRISLTELAGRLEIGRDPASQIADFLVRRNLLHVSALSSESETYYETRLSALTRPLRRPPPDIWKKVDD
jgi:hypothetical protein